MSGEESLQDRMETVTRRWWFWLIVVLIQLVPPITTFKYDPSRTSEVIGEILGNAYAFRPEWRALYAAILGYKRQPAEIPIKEAAHGSENERSIAQDL